MPRESPEMWTRIGRGPHEDEAGRNLGPFAVVLDKHLLEQQNAKKLYGPKTNCAAGVNSGQKIQKDQKKKPTSTSEAPVAKAGHCACRAYHHLRRSKPPQPPLLPNLSISPTLSPRKEPAHPFKEGAREPATCSLSPLLQQGPC